MDKVFSIAPGYCFFKRYLPEHWPQTGFFWLALDGLGFFTQLSKQSSSIKSLAAPSHTGSWEEITVGKGSWKPEHPAQKDLAHSESQKTLRCCAFFSSSHVWKHQPAKPIDSRAHSSVPFTAVQPQGFAQIPHDCLGHTLHDNDASKTGWYKNNVDTIVKNAAYMHYQHSHSQCYWC